MHDAVGAAAKNGGLEEGWESSQPTGTPKVSAVWTTVCSIAEP